MQIISRLIINENDHLLLPNVRLCSFQILKGSTTSRNLRVMGFYPSHVLKLIKGLFSMSLNVFEAKFFLLQNHKGLTISHMRFLLQYSVHTKYNFKSVYNKLLQSKLTMAMKRPMKRKYVRWSGLMEEAGLICRQ